MYFYSKFIAFFLSLYIFFQINYVWSANFFVSINDIFLMKQAGISSTVIDLFSTEQTCSVTPAFLIQLHYSGADDALLEKYIREDHYNDPNNSGSFNEHNDFFNSSYLTYGPNKQSFLKPGIIIEFDSYGNELIIYKTGRKLDRNLNENRNNFFINIENIKIKRTFKN